MKLNYPVNDLMQSVVQQQQRKINLKKEFLVTCEYNFVTCFMTNILIETRLNPCYSLSFSTEFKSGKLVSYFIRISQYHKS